MKRNLQVLTIACSTMLLAATIACNSKTEQASTTKAGGNTSSAPSGEQAAQRNMALVRFVNAVPGEKADLWFGNSKAFSDVSYKDVTAYKELPGERRDFVFERAGAQPTTNSNVKNSEGLNDGAHYTVVALIDKDGHQKLNVINDDLSEPASNRSKVRIINASNEELDVLSPVDLTKGTADRMRHPQNPGQHAANRNDNNWDKWFTGVNSDSATTHKDVDPIATTLEVRRNASGHRNRAAAGAVQVPVDFAAGKIYSLVVTGGGHGHPLEVIKVADELVGSAATTPSTRS